MKAHYIVFPALPPSIRGNSLKVRVFYRLHSLFLFSNSLQGILLLLQTLFTLQSHPYSSITILYLTSLNNNLILSLLSYAFIDPSQTYAYLIHILMHTCSLPCSHHIMSISLCINFFPKLHSIK